MGARGPSVPSKGDPGVGAQENRGLDAGNNTAGSDDAVYTLPGVQTI